MHLTLLDWILVVVPVLGVIALAAYTRRYVRAVADFVAAGRCAGRYLLTNARGESLSGVTSTVSYFELFLVAGFIVTFWSTISGVVMLLVAISGYVVYRYRQTKALTIAQFFEMRYSRRFRIFMGTVAFVAGLLNYGVFPQVAANFFIYYLGLPTGFSAGGIVWSTSVVFMAAYLSLSCLLVTFGGQVTNMVTDCVEGLLSHAIYIVIIVALLLVVSWEQIATVLSGGFGTLLADEWAPLRIDPGYSPVNPFDAFKTQDFNFTYVALGLFIAMYTVMSWQGGHGFNAAARTPHEGRMAQVLFQWRLYARMTVLVVIVICVVTFLRHPDFTEEATAARTEVNELRGQYLGHAAPAPHAVGSQAWVEDKANVSQLERQQVITVGLRHMLPVGVGGLFLLMMVLALFASDGSHQHSWSTIFVQDVFLPLRSAFWVRRHGREPPPLEPRQHLRILRLSVLGVGLFAFGFSCVVSLKVPIWMWFAITGAVYTAGAGSVIIGGLYTRWGTTAGAWAGMVTGSVSSISLILLSYFWDRVGPALERWSATVLAAPLDLPERFWLNSQWHAAISVALAATAYVTISLWSGRRAGRFDLDALLKREPAADPRPQARQPWWQRALGVDGEFTRGDRITTYVLFTWNLSLALATVGMLVWHYGVGAYAPHLRLDNRDWVNFWAFFGLGVPFLISVATLVWFTWGGYRDLSDFFRTLRSQVRDARDDGAVRRPPSGS